MTKILCIAQVEDRTNLDKQIAKQTVQPSRTIFWVDQNPATGIPDRRKRIAENHQKLREIVKAYKPDLVWQVEQDGDYPSHTLEQLLDDLQQRPHAAYISGIQVGRHGLYCLGAWTDFTGYSFRSLDYTRKGLQHVEATGFYCILARAERWLEGKCEWNGEPYGPDVVWSRSIRGDKYCDMELPIGHIVKNGIIRPSDMSTCNVEFMRHPDGRWGYKQL